MMGRILSAGALLVCAVGVTRGVAQRAHIGVHGGYNTEFEHGAVGLQAYFPLASAVEFYPSFDYYAGNTGTLWGWNADIKLRATGAPLYFGGGINLLTGDGTSETGFNLIGGLETRYGETHPYFEARGLFHDAASLQLVFGLNFTLR